MAKTTEKTLERTYNVPLRKEYMKAPRWNRTKKAVTALRQFLAKHMKSEEVLLSKELNEFLWKHGIQNPPHHVKVKAVKDDKGVVKAELVGAEKPASKKKDKTEVKADKKEVKPAAKEHKKAKEEAAAE